MTNRALHVLILPKWYPHPEDPQLGNFIALFAEKMAERHLISVVYPYQTSREAKTEVIENGNLLEIRVPYPPATTPLAPLHKLINFNRHRSALDKGVVQMLARRIPPHLVHAQVLIRPALFAGNFSQHWEIPWMLTEHSSVFLRENALSGIRKRAIRQVCRSAAHLVAVSPPLAKSLSVISQRDDVKVIPNLVEFNSTEPAPRDSDKIQIAMVADLVDEIKNISGVLQAIHRLKEKLPSFELKIVGDGKDAEMLKKISQDLNLTDCVTFLGQKIQPEVMAFLATVDFVITNSRTETFSVVSAEAVASGKPVIVTRCGGPEHWFREEYGLLIDRDDPNQLDGAIIKMSETFGDYSHHQMTESIRSQFDTETIISQYENLYFQIAKL